MALAFAAVADPTKPPDDEMVAAVDLSLEAALLHIGNLTESLAEDDRNPDHVKARDWFPGDREWSAPMPSDRTLRKLQPTISGRLAHVGWERHERPGKDWAVVTIADHVLAVVAAFGAAVRASGRPGADELEAAVRVADDTLRPVRSAPGQGEVSTTTNSTPTLSAGSCGLPPAP